MSVLVAGCGTIGRRHIENALRPNKGRVFAFDVSESKRASVQRDLDVRVVGKLSEALEASPTTALVASPTDQHIAIALEAVKRGCHVFVEKPVSHS